MTSHKYGQIVPTPCGSILPHTKPPQVPYNATNRFLSISSNIPYYSYHPQLTLQFSDFRKSVPGSTDCVGLVDAWGVCNAPFPFFSKPSWYIHNIMFSLFSFGYRKSRRVVKTWKCDKHGQPWLLLKKRELGMVDASSVYKSAISLHARFIC